MQFQSHRERERERHTHTHTHTPTITVDAVMDFLAAYIKAKRNFNNNLMLIEKLSDMQSAQQNVLGLKIFHRMVVHPNPCLLKNTTFK
jgi:hypothetical protein